MGLKTLLERGHGDCAWPLLDGPEQLFCGEPVSPGRPYCPDCLARMYRPGSALDADRVARTIERKPRSVVAPARELALDELIGAEIAA